MTRRLMMDDFDRLATEPELAAQRDWWARLTVAGGVAAGRVLVWVEPWTNKGERDLTVEDPYGWTWGHAPSTHTPGVSDQMVGAPIEWFPPELAAAWRRCLLAHEAADDPIVDEAMPPPGEIVVWRRSEGPVEVGHVNTADASTGYRMRVAGRVEAVDRAVAELFDAALEEGRDDAWPPSATLTSGASWSWRAPEAVAAEERSEVAAMGGAAWPLPDAEWVWPPPETPRLLVDPDPDETGPHRGEYRLFYVDDAGLLVHCGYVAAEAVPEVNARLPRG